MVSIKSQQRQIHKRGRFHQFSMHAHKDTILTGSKCSNFAKKNLKFPSVVLWPAGHERTFRINIETWPVPHDSSDLCVMSTQE